METEKRVEQIGGVAAIIFLVIGCFVVLRPFVSALMWAAILCFSTWPVYSRLERAFKGRRTGAALAMTGLITIVLVAPFAIVGFSLADDVANMARAARDFLNRGTLEPPAWVGQLPLVGQLAETSWREAVQNREKLLEGSKTLVAGSKGWFFERGLDLGQGIFQLSLSVFIAFFFYRDGAGVVEKIQVVAKRIIGDRTQHLLAVVGGTVKGVVYGILGTAIAQGILAGIGLWIAGVPLPLLLALLTFFLSLIPMGPPLVWAPTTVWLIYHGRIGWGIFLGIWGLFVISGIDNFLKPYLISRGSKLPFALVFLGVFGGVIAFGFIGIFLGPTLLAVGYSLIQEWSAQKTEARA